MKNILFFVVISILAIAAMYWVAVETNAYEAVHEFLKGPMRGR